VTAVRPIALLWIAAAACASPRVTAPPAPVHRAPCALDRLAPLLDSAVAAGAAPGAVVAVSSHGARYLYGTGKLALDDPRRPDGNTIYDLASLTKVIATTTLAMQA
jgi:CubicO group peptidase (beta-lactamase class C family)